MIDPVKILQRAWHILWNYRTLWAFGLILALVTAGGSSGNGDNNGVQWREEGRTPPQFENAPKSWEEFTQQVQDFFAQGIPEWGVSGEALNTFLWTIGAFIVFMILISILVSIAYYVSVTSVIRMVNEYENSGTKLSLREGIRIGWSSAAWRAFLINLIVNLPGLLFFLALLITGVSLFVAFTNGNLTFTPVVLVVLIGLVFLGIFVVIILSVILGALRPFFWRLAILEDDGVRDSLRGGLAMVRENWKSVGLMWLVMIGLGIAWAIVSILAAILTLPVVLITTLIAAAVVAIPGLLLVGLFSLFLGGPLTWIAAGLFVLPLFFVIAFSPWLLLGSWQTVFTSTVWTLTYREIKALPMLAIPSDLQPVGD